MKHLRTACSSCPCPPAYGKATLSLLSFLFVVVTIVTSAVLTRRQYNTTPSTDWILVGGLRSDGATFRVRTGGTSSNEDGGSSGTAGGALAGAEATPGDGSGSSSSSATRLVVSLSADWDDADSSVVFAHQLDLPNATTTAGVESVTVSGLEANTQYHYFTLQSTTTSSSTTDPANSGTATSTSLIRRGKFRTPQPEGTRFNFTVATAGCATTGSTSPIFTRIASDHNPLLYINLGDFHYEDLDTTDLNVRINAVDLVMGSSSQAELLGSTGLAYMWDDHDWLGDESQCCGVGRQTALESYGVAFPHYDPLPASTMKEYEGQGQAVPAYHAFTIGTIRFILSDLRSEANGTHIYSDAQKQWLFNELSNASSYDFVVWVTPSPWLGPPQKDDTWWGYPEDRTELSDYITRTDRAAEGPRNLIAIASDAHMVGFDDGRNTYYGTSSSSVGDAAAEEEAEGEGLAAAEIYSFPLLQSGPLDRMGSAKGGPYSHGCSAMLYQRNHQYSTLEFTFPDVELAATKDGAGEQEGGGAAAAEACITVTSYRVNDSASKKETILSKKMCGKTFASTELAGTGTCESTWMEPGILALVIIAGVLGVVAIVIGCWGRCGGCSGGGDGGEGVGEGGSEGGLGGRRREAVYVSIIVVLSYFLTYIAGIGVPFAMGAYGNFDILPVAIISLLQMLCICVYLCCWRKRENAGAAEGKEGEEEEEQAVEGEPEEAAEAAAAKDGAKE